MVKGSNLGMWRTVIQAILFLLIVAPAESQNATVATQSRANRTLADSLRRADGEQLHIFYVHGMAFDGPGHSDSEMLRRSICKFLRDCETAEGEFDGREYADQDKFVLNADPPELWYLGTKIWTKEEWNAAAPFVDHWKLTRRSAPAIYVDEINWWPLVFAVKCRQIIAKEAEFIGPDATYIDSCSSTQTDPQNPGRYKSYAWIDPVEAKRLKALHGKAVRVNRDLKDYILDWGFTDAVLAVGPTQSLLVEGIREVLLKSVKVSAQGVRDSNSEPAENQEFVIVSHSLGSYLIFSALDVNLAEKDGAQLKAWKAEFEKILGRTSLVYFFANQLRLLECARLDVESGSNIVTHLEVWGRLRRNYLEEKHLDGANAPEIVAWGDPSDLLTWQVPELATVKVKNQPVKNGIHWFWLIENPIKAHGNYDVNKKVITDMLRPENNPKSQ